MLTDTHTSDAQPLHVGATASTFRWRAASQGESQSAAAVPLKKKGLSARTWNLFRRDRSEEVDWSQIRAMHGLFLHITVERRK